MASPHVRSTAEPPLFAGARDLVSIEVGGETHALQALLSTLTVDVRLLSIGQPI